MRNQFYLICSTAVLLLFLINESTCSMNKFSEHLKQRKIQLEQNHKNEKNIIHYLNKRGNKYELMQSNNDLPNKNNDWIARLQWINDDYNKTGWSILEIETNSTAKDLDQAFYAGFLEGYTTKDMISLHIINSLNDFCQDPGDELCNKLFDFLDTNIKWMNNMILANPNDPYWHQAGLALTQFYGLAYGYYFNNDSFIEDAKTVIERMRKAELPTYLNILALQLGGDVSEVLASLQGISDPFMAGSCSALVKVLDGNSDIYISHDTWVEYQFMLRFLKHYKFHYHLNDIDPTEVAGAELTFSSYPGSIVSIDDFILSSANMAIIETTIGNSNPALWKYVTPQLNLYWIRIQIASRLAHGTQDWAKWFSLYNSGTYNNQWMILDYKLFTPGGLLPDGLFLVLEQIPGDVVYEDKTYILRERSFWPSYNIASYPYVYNISGTYDAFVKYGNVFSYENTSRALIFKRDQSNVKDMESMMKMMRYNNFTLDPLSRCDCDPPYSSELTIAARSDLNPANGKYPIGMLGHRGHGAVDMKLTNSKLIKNLNFVAISGPTHGAPNVPPFQWSKSDYGTKLNHFGQPDKFDFDPFYTNWKL